MQILKNTDDKNGTAETDICILTQGVLGPTKINSCHFAKAQVK